MSKRFPKPEITLDVYTASPEPSARTFRATLPHFESHFHGVVEPVDKK